MEHQRVGVGFAKNAQNQWVVHSCTEHGNSHIPDVPFTARIMRTNDHADRKLGEAIETPLTRTLAGGSSYHQEKIFRQAYTCAKL
jgi:hypothetical protein